MSQSDQDVLWTNPGGFRVRDEERGWRSTSMSHPSRCPLRMQSHSVSFQRVPLLTDEAVEAQRG